MSSKTISKTILLPDSTSSSCIVCTKLLTVKAFSHDEIATATLLSQLMGCLDPVMCSHGVIATMRLMAYTQGTGPGPGPGTGTGTGMGTGTGAG